MRHFLRRFLADAARAQDESPLVGAVRQLEARWAGEPDDALRTAAARIAERLAEARTLNRLEQALVDALPESFALTCAASRRISPALPVSDAAIAAAIRLSRGSIVNAPPEDKTAALALVSLLEGLSPRPVHVAFASRFGSFSRVAQAAAIGRLLGVSFAVVDPEGSYLVTAPAEDDELEEGSAGGAAEGERILLMLDVGPVSRAAAYAADVVFGTAATLALDGLRDELAADPIDHVGRGRGALIVDDASQLLLEVGEIELAVNGLSEPPSDLLSRADRAVAGLVAGLDVLVGEEGAAFTAGGLVTLEASLGEPFDLDHQEDDLLGAMRACLVARFQFERGLDYDLVDGAVVFIDEATGELLYGQSCDLPLLQQALELKEGMSLVSPAEPLAATSFEVFFRSYEKVSGLTGGSEPGAVEAAA